MPLSKESRGMKRAAARERLLAAKAQKETAQKEDKVKDASAKKERISSNKRRKVTNPYSYSAPKNPYNKAEVRRTTNNAGIARGTAGSVSSTSQPNINTGTNNSSLAAVGSAHNNDEAQKSTGTSAAASSPNEKSAEQKIIINLIVIAKCGLSEVNGTYHKAIGVTYQGASVYRYLRGGWGDARNTIYRREGTWYIGHWDGRRPGESVWYRCKNKSTDNYPPKNGWVGTQIGYLPAPKCRLIRTNASASEQPKHVNQIIVEGCDDNAINGTYNRVSGEISGNAGSLSNKHQFLGDLKYNGTPVYRKPGDITDFAIYLRDGEWRDDEWCISSWNWDENIPDTYLPKFTSSLNANCMVPPENGWVPVINAYATAPKCRLIEIGKERATTQREENHHYLSHLTPDERRRHYFEDDRRRHYVDDPEFSRNNKFSRIFSAKILATFMLRDHA